MKSVQLIKHDLQYVEEINRLCQAREVREALGLPEQTIEQTKQFFQQMVKEEEKGKTVSRLILNEKGTCIGITTLMFIDYEKMSCHIGSWLGVDYWGQGYNLLSKIALLHTAFHELNLNFVFAGARVVNIRSQKAQEKLPFITLNVEKEFPNEHMFLEKKERQPCVLHVIRKEDFEAYIKSTV